MTDAEKELITRAAWLERCLDLEDELDARRAVVAGVNGQITTTTGGSVTYITAGPPAPGPVSVPSVFGVRPATCPNCGAPLSGGVPAADTPKDVSGDRGVVPTKGANVAGEDAPSGWMSRDKLL